MKIYYHYYYCYHHHHYYYYYYYYYYCYWVYLFYTDDYNDLYFLTSRQTCETPSHLNNSK